MIPTIKSISLALAAASLTWLMGASSAFAAEQVQSETVKFHDLNTNTPEGIHQLYTRIHLAARRVCWENDPSRLPAASYCARKAEGDAIATLNLPQLTAYYKAKVGNKAEPLVASR